MIEYSILIPSYDPEGKNTQTVSRLLTSIDENSRGKNYEIIVRKNGNSYTESHNDALASSRGKYIVILNDDTLIQDPLWLEKLKDDNKIISWKEGKFGLTGESCWDFSCWAMSREIFEKIGYFDERFKDGIGFEDNDYHYRAKQLGIEYEVRPIQMLHYGGLVLNMFFGRANDKREKNHNLFLAKWRTE